MEEVESLSDVKDDGHGCVSEVISTPFGACYYRTDGTDWWEFRFRTWNSRDENGEIITQMQLKRCKPLIGVIHFRRTESPVPVWEKGQQVGVTYLRVDRDLDVPNGDSTHARIWDKSPSEAQCKRVSEDVIPFLEQIVRADRNGGPARAANYRFDRENAERKLEVAREEWAKAQADYEVAMAKDMPDPPTF